MVTNKEVHKPKQQNKNRNKAKARSIFVKLSLQLPHYHTCQAHTTYLWNEQQPQEYSSNQHDTKTKYSLVNDQMSGQDKSGQAQNYQDHGGRVNDDEHLLGVIKDFDLDPTGGDGKDEGHHLEQDEVHVLQRDP